MQQTPEKRRRDKLSRWVLIILGLFVLACLLVLVSFVCYRDASRKKARDARRVSDIKQIQNALKLYYLDHGEYPNGGIAKIENVCLCKDGFRKNCSYEEYSGTECFLVPVAPTPADGKCTNENNSYFYKRLSPDKYILRFCLGGKIGELPKGINQLTNKQ